MQLLENERAMLTFFIIFLDNIVYSLIVIGTSLNLSYYFEILWLAKKTMEKVTRNWVCTTYASSEYVELLLLELI